MNTQNPMHRGFRFSDRVMRGAHYNSYSDDSQASDRIEDTPKNRFNDYGFRLVRNK
jgi:formylglycine-generating enzyme required for sulfatase activity